MYYKIMDKDGVLKGTVPYVEDDPNNGLPDWFFEGTYFEFLIDTDAGTVEWVPPCGPAPCWKASLFDFDTSLQIFEAFKKWNEESY